MNLALDLRKSNLFLELTHGLLTGLIEASYGFKKSTENSKVKQEEIVKGEKYDHYTSAPVRRVKPVSIERELAASGNAW